MNDLLFVQELAAVLAGDSYTALRDALCPTLNPDGSTPEGPLPPNIFPAQAAANTSHPILILSGTYDNYGPRRLGTVTFELRGRIGDETGDGEHQARFELLWAALLGSLVGDPVANKTAAKAALIAALAARNQVTVADYGPAPQTALTADVDGEDLRTVLQIRIAWAFALPA